MPRLQQAVDGRFHSHRRGTTKCMKPTIEILISPSGEISIDAVRFKGAECEKATRFLEEALGVVGQKTRKPEYHQNAKTKNQQRIGG